MAATQYVTATFNGTQDSIAVTWSDLGGTQYITAGVETDGTVIEGVTLVSVTRTGATVTPYARFTGTVTVEIATQ